MRAPHLPPAFFLQSSGFKEPAERGPDLGDHVRGGGGAAVLLEGLVAALPREGARAEGRHQQRAEAGGRGDRGQPGGSPQPPQALVFPPTSALGPKLAISTV